MSVKKFRFVSPGIFINEIDNSQLPGAAEGIGPVVIGRAERGPGMRPVTVNSFSEFIEMFGNPIPGGEGGDIWRDGNRTAPTYAAYAAQAWLRNAAPLTFIRLLGHQHDDATVGGVAGWSIGDDGGAYGLFIGSDEDELGTTTKSSAAAQGMTLTQDNAGDAKDGEEVAITVAAADLPGGPTVTLGGSAAELDVDVVNDSGNPGAAATLVSAQLSLTQDDLGVNIETVQVNVSEEARVAPESEITLGGTAEALVVTVANHNNGGGEIVRATTQDVVNALNGVAPVTPDVVVGAGIDPATLSFSAAPVAGTEAAEAAVLGETPFGGGVEVRAAAANVTVDQIRQILNNEDPAGVNVIEDGVDRDDLTFSAASASGASIMAGTLTFAGGLDASGIMALAAVIYHDGEGDIGLVGSNLQDVDVAAADGLNTFVKCQGTNNEVKLGINGKSYSINFSKSSKKYIRKVLNTNPTLLNEAHTRDAAVRHHFLGETYDSHLASVVGSRDAGDGFAILMKLNNGDGTLDKGDHEQQAQAPKTGWVLSQHQGVHDEFAVNAQGELPVEKLFRFEGIDDGAWATQNVKIEISDITAADGDFNPYGSFTVTLRSTKDSDQAPQYLERYTSVNLNPVSSDYIARRIGDMQTIWSYSENRYRTIGQHPCMSRFVRVEMNEDVDAGVTDPSLIPFGFQGPPTPRSVKISYDGGADSYELEAASCLTHGATSEALNIAVDADAGDLGGGADYIDSVTLIFPSQACRQSSAEGRLASAQAASFGATSNEEDSTREDKSYAEMLKPWGARSNNHDAQDLGDETLTRSALRSNGCFDPAETAIAALVDGMTASAADCRTAAGDADGKGIVCNFTLDDLCMVNVQTSGDSYKKSEQHMEWLPGSRRAGASVTVLGDDSFNSSDDADDGKKTLGTDRVDGTYKSILDAGFSAFTLPLVGGSDGVDITQKEPFSEAELDGGTPQTNYAYNTVKRAIDSIADPEVVECNLAVIPGLKNEGLTGHLLTTCEGRADTLAIIDLDGDYSPSTDNKSSEAARLPQVRQTVQTLKDRRINSSYGCCYFPWVQIRDTINDAVLWSPPSVVALGTMASSQRKTEVWFAPAGFNRGGLTEGSAGLPVSQVRYRLTSKERDALYEANINPIATFPSEGIVVFGQKTLQVTPSALDRINVRRLMIYLKKEVSRIAATILFDQNTSVTWQRFIAQTEPFLASVKSRFGLSEFKVILDETTTTPDLIDRNVLYAKIMLKPARAIEFIALDFVISRSGASFED